MMSIARPGAPRPTEPVGVGNHRAHVPNIHPVSALPDTSFRAMFGSLITKYSEPRIVSATTVWTFKFVGSPACSSRSASASGIDAGMKILLTSHSSIERLRRAGSSNVLPTTEHPYHQLGYIVPSN